jgi:hypothetical protein
VDVLGLKLLREKPTKNIQRPEDLHIAYDVLWSHAVDHVRTHRKIIESFARKFIPYSPYQRRDYLQEAYLAAFNALVRSLIRGVPEQFEQYFWTELRKEYSKMATEPAYRDLLGSGSSGQPCFFGEYREDRLQELAVEKPDDTNPERMLIEKEERGNGDYTSASIQAALALMTKKERQVWEYLLGNNGEIPKLKDIARRLRITRQRVQALRDQGLERVRKHFAP